jgi:hypothetical protein
MKVVCVCFGGYKELIVRSSPFDKDANIIGSLPSHSSFDVEHCIYNDNWFKIQGQEAYVVMWLRSKSGLIDYQLDRAHLKMFERKSVIDDELATRLKNNDTDLLTRLEKITLDDDPVSISEPPPAYKAKKSTRSKKERIPATVRNIVWVTHFHTSKKGQCWLCKVEDISSANFECGHVVSEKNGGKPTIDNLRPICSFCNKSVGTMNMEDFKRKYNIP